LAKEIDVPIVITGRLADTPAEKAVREEDVAEMDRLIKLGVDPEEAILQAADAFHIDPHQVKKSTGDPEVDVFIPKNIWDTFSTEKKEEVRQSLIDIFNPLDSPNYRPDFKVDFYQDIEDRLPGWPDPSTNIPPGSIIFGPDGMVTHETLSP